MSTTKDRATVREALRVIRKHALGEKIARCVEVSAELHGVEWRLMLGKSRGCPRAARARVVAMSACVSIGVPMLTTAKAFKRERRAVHSAIQIGRPGREERDEAVLEAMREVVRRVG